MITYKIHMEAICDGCGFILAIADLHRPSDIAPKRWAWSRFVQAGRGVIQQRRYRGSLIYCGTCADKAPTVKKRTT